MVIFIIEIIIFFIAYIVRLIKHQTPFYTDPFYVLMNREIMLFDLLNLPQSQYEYDNWNTNSSSKRLIYIIVFYYFQKHQLNFPFIQEPEIEKEVLEWMNTGYKSKELTKDLFNCYKLTEDKVFIQKPHMISFIE